MTATLSTDSEERKNTPLFSGFLAYFPAAAAAVARLSQKGNDKHNPGEPLHHARGKSMDHADCIVRHQLDFDQIDPETGEYHAVMVAWRAMAQLQELLEAKAGAPLARGARVPEPLKMPTPLICLCGHQRELHARVASNNFCRVNDCGCINFISFMDSP